MSTGSHQMVDATTKQGYGSPASKVEATSTGGAVMTLLALPVEALSEPTELSVRTRVTVPLRFPDGYATTADVFTFTGLSDGKEHLLLGLGDWRGALARSRGGGGAARGAAPRGRPSRAGL